MADILLFAASVASCAVYVKSKKSCEMDVEGGGDAVDCNPVDANGFVHINAGRLKTYAAAAENEFSRLIKGLLNRTSLNAARLKNYAAAAENEISRLFKALLDRTSSNAVPLKNYAAAAENDVSRLINALLDRTSLNATERICTVTADNQVLPSGALRADMRLHNLWHRATYVLIVHETDAETNQNKSLENTYVLVQRRSALKDYCPRKLDPLPGGVVEYGESYKNNAIRELQEEMGIQISAASGNSLSRLFSFPYQDDRVRVWGDVFECKYRGRVEDLVLQQEEVESILRMSLGELKDQVDEKPEDFMPDACHAIKLYFQRLGDLHVKRRLLKGYSSGNLDSYQLRPKPRAVFFDCDDCLYFDGWKTADHLTKKIDEWCVNHGLRKGEAYELYKKYGTALRGLLAEGYLENTGDAIDKFLADVHDIPVHELLQPDKDLREMLLRMDPTIPKYIFTASIRDHAARCLQALGIDDLFVDIIDCKTCNLETKHSPQSFETAMRIAGVEDPERCVFLDDNLKNIEAARQMGWRSVLVGKVGRDCGLPVTSSDAENEIDRIHAVPKVLPELFEI